MCHRKKGNSFGEDGPRPACPVFITKCRFRSHRWGEFRFDTAITACDPTMWGTRPALFGHAILVLAVLLAIGIRSSHLSVALGNAKTAKTGTSRNAASCSTRMPQAASRNETGVTAAAHAS